QLWMISVAPAVDSDIQQPMLQLETSRPLRRQRGLHEDDPVRPIREHDLGIGFTVADADGNRVVTVIGFENPRQAGAADAAGETDGEELHGVPQSTGSFIEL